MDINKKNKLTIQRKSLRIATLTMKKMKKSVRKKLRKAERWREKKENTDQNRVYNNKFVIQIYQYK